MPTGYTAAIIDGITFEQFAMNCARAFGATVTMRDDPSDAPIPDEFEPSDHHAKALAEAERELKTLSSLTKEEANTQASVDWNRQEKRRIDRLKEIANQRHKYELMLADAVAWQPPTPDHNAMKTFMVEQIKQSIDFDCSTDYYAKETPKLTGEQWREERIKKAQRNIDYHRRNHAEELDRTAQRNAWVKALRDSLKTESA